MLIDILFAIAICFAVWHGWQRGLVLGVFSLVAIIIGLAAAMKLSIFVADYLGKSINISKEWLPFISFLAVFIVVVLLIRLGAKAIEKSLQVIALGWVNKLGGIVFYSVIYMLTLSVILFYAEHMKLLQPTTIEQSATYSFLQPWGPKVINGFGSLVPIFRDMFAKLELFFENISQKISAFL